MSIFAEAYRRQQGTDWTPAQALEQLYGTLKPGQNLNTSKLSPFLVEVLRERAAPKLDIAMRTSQAWQGRFQNTTSDWTRRFSQSGGEAGYRNIFMGATNFMESFPEIPEATARKFESITNALTAIVAAPGSIRSALQGEDSLIGDWLGEEVIARARENLDSIAGAVNRIKKLLPARSNDPDGPSNFIGHVVHRASLIGTGFLEAGGTVGRVLQGQENPFNIPLAAGSAVLGAPYIAATGSNTPWQDVKFGGGFLYDRSLDLREDLTRYGLDRQNALNGVNSRPSNDSKPTISVQQVTIEVNANSVPNLEDYTRTLYDSVLGTTLNYGDN